MSGEKTTIDYQEADSMANKAAKSITAIARKYGIKIAADKGKRLHDLSLQEINENFNIRQFGSVTEATHLRRPSIKNRRDHISSTATLIPFTSHIKEAVKSLGSLKPRLDFAVRRIKLQALKLGQATERFNQRDEAIFARMVDAQTKHDTVGAIAFAKELIEIRKMERLIIYARVALDQIELRLRAASELENVVSTLGPAVGVLRSVRAGLETVSPEAESELGEIGNLLSGIIIEAGQSSEMTLNFKTVNEDATKILSEAAEVAEKTIEEKFQESPRRHNLGKSDSKTGERKH